MPLPTRRHVAPDQLARGTLAERLFGVLLGPAEVGVAMQPGGEALCSREELALAIARIRFCSPPRRGDRAPSVWRQDQVDARLVHPFPDLPPRGRAAVPKLEIDGRNDA